MLAVKCNKRTVVEELLNACANPFLKDQMDQEAKDYNVSFNNITNKRNEDSINEMLEQAKKQWQK